VEVYLHCPIFVHSVMFSYARDNFRFTSVQLAEMQNLLHIMSNVSACFLKCTLWKNVRERFNFGEDSNTITCSHPAPQSQNISTSCSTATD